MVPAVLTGLVVLVCGWLAFNPPAGQFQRLFEVLAGAALPIVCAGAAEVFARHGFKTLRLGSHRFKPDKIQAQRIKQLIPDSVKSKLDLFPELVDLGAVSLIMSDRSQPNRLWISKAALEQLPEMAIKQVLGFEIELARRDSLIDRVLLAGGFWWVNIITMMLLIESPLVMVLWTCLAIYVFYLINDQRQAGLRKSIDQLVVAKTGGRDYAAGLAAYQRATWGEAGRKLAYKRLVNAGIEKSEAAVLIEACQD